MQQENRKLKFNYVISVLIIISVMVGVIGWRAESVLAKTYYVVNNCTIVVYKGDKINLRVGNHEGSYDWRSTNNKVASVDKKGKVVAKKKGTVTISVKIGKKKYKYKIIVKEKTNIKKGFYCGEYESGAQMRLVVRKISDDKLTFEMAYVGDYEKGSTEMTAKIIGDKVTFQMKGDFAGEGKGILKLNKKYITFTNEYGNSIKLYYVNSDPDVWQDY